MKLYFSHQPEVFVEVRKYLKWSQGRLARKLGVHKSTISRIEAGLQYPSGRLLEKLQKLVDVPLAELAARSMTLCVAQEPAEIPQELRDLSTEQLGFMRVHYQDEAKALRQKIAHKQEELLTVCKHHELGTALQPGLEKAVEMVAHLQEERNSVGYTDAYRKDLENHASSLKKQLRNQRVATTQPYKLLLLQRKLAKLERELQEMQHELALIAALVAERNAHKANPTALEQVESVAPVVAPPTEPVSSREMVAAEQLRVRPELAKRAAPLPKVGTAQYESGKEHRLRRQQQQPLRVIPVRIVAPEKATQRCRPGRYATFRLAG